MAFGYDGRVVGDGEPIEVLTTFSGTIMHCGGRAYRAGCRVGLCTIKTIARRKVCCRASAHILVGGLRVLARIREDVHGPSHLRRRRWWRAYRIGTAPGPVTLAVDHLCLVGVGGWH